MKKIFFTLTVFFCFITITHANTISKIDMDIKIDNNGNANITETWDVQGTDGTEWYKVMNNLGNSEITDFTVSMDGKPLTFKKWDINETLQQKKNYYGINYTDNGLELCFGKYDYNHHVFTLNYNVSNFIINTSDSQVLYWKLIDRLSNVNFKNFSVSLSSYYEFPDTLDVWGYGYKGYAYVENGKIYMSSEETMNEKYAVMLVKFPLNTFNTDNYKKDYNTFDDILNQAEKGTFEYNYNENNIGEIIAIFISIIMTLVLPIAVTIIVGISVYKNGYSYKNNKKIIKKQVNLFREIPCNKDIYYANALIKLNNFGFKKENILGAIILKWIKEQKIVFKNENKGIFNKNTSIIDLTLNPTFEIDAERKLFQMMYKASKDGYLEAKELEKWCKKHYSSFLNLFDSILNKEINKLKSEGHIYKRTYKKESKKKNVMDDKIFEDSTQLYGLKKFLKEFSNIKEKEAIEVSLWDEYLMFAYLFGMADKVAKQFKNLYPEIIEKMQNSNFDYNTFIFINTLSTSSVSAASHARAAAESYSSGGGGFSSGGGGGGSFGGGGGGSR